MSNVDILNIRSELARFALVGITNNSLLYGAYVALTNLYFLDPKISMTLTYILGLLMGYFMHRHVTFPGIGKASYPFLRYVFSHCIGYGSNFIILLFFVDYLGLSHIVVQGVAIFLIAILLFFLMKYFVFRKINN